MTRMARMTFTESETAMLLQMGVRFSTKRVANEQIFSHRNRILAPRHPNKTPEARKAYLAFPGGLWGTSLGSFLHQIISKATQTPKATYTSATNSPRAFGNQF